MAEKVDSAALVAQAQELRKSAPAAEPMGHGRASFPNAGAPTQISVAGVVSMPSSHAGSGTDDHLNPQDDGVDAANARLDDVKAVAMAKSVMTPAETALVCGGDAKGALLASMQKAVGEGKSYSMTGVERWIAHPMRKAAEEEDEKKKKEAFEAMEKGVAAGRRQAADASPVLEMMVKSFDAGFAALRAEVSALRGEQAANAVSLRDFRKALSPVVAGTADSVAQLGEQITALAGGAASAPKSQSIAQAAGAPQSNQPFQHFQVIEKGVPNVPGPQAQQTQGMPVGADGRPNIYVGPLRKAAGQALLQLFRKAQTDNNPSEVRRIEKAIGQHQNGCQIVDGDIEHEVINRLGVAAAR